MSYFALTVAAISTTVFLAAGGYTLLPREWYDARCKIKGNVSVGSGDKIFHVPGQRDYILTKIRRDYGERWFCSEKDARDAGWRKATR